MFAKVWELVVSLGKAIEALPEQDRARLQQRLLLIQTRLYAARNAFVVAGPAGAPVFVRFLQEAASDAQQLAEELAVLGVRGATTILANIADAMRWITDPFSTAFGKVGVFFLLGGAALAVYLGVKYRKPIGRGAARAGKAALYAHPKTRAAMALYQGSRARS